MIDKYGLYVQADGANGDSAHRTGLALALKGLLKLPNMNEYMAIAEIEIRPGIYIRHPADYFGDWSADPQCFSRDQASRIILGYAVNNLKDDIKTWFWEMTKRGFFHQNNKDSDTGKWKMPDIIAPGELRNVIRGLDLWYLYPVLVFLDLFFLGDIYFRKEWDGASLYVPDLKYALYKYWTPVAWLANKLNNRTNWLQEALSNHALENNGCVELQTLFQELSKLNG